VSPQKHEISIMQHALPAIVNTMPSRSVDAVRHAAN
jgi:hypothetical protein